MGKRCPLCESVRVVFVVGAGRAFCITCGGEWATERPRQTALERVMSHQPSGPGTPAGTR